MNVGPMNPGINNISNADFVRNAQHVGMQREGVSKSQTEETQTTASDEVFISSQAGQTEETNNTGKTEGTQQNGKTEGTQQNGKTEGTEGTTQTGNTTETTEGSETEEAAPANGQAGSGAEDVSMEDGMPGAGLGSETAETCGCEGAYGPQGAYKAPTMEEQMAQLKEMEEARIKFEESMLEIINMQKLHWEKMMQMINDTYDAIYEIQQQVLQRQFATQDRVFMGWCGAICGGR